MRWKDLHDIMYINWRETAKYNYGVKKEEFDLLKESLDPTKRAKSKTKIEDWEPTGTWCETVNGDIHKLSIHTEEGLQVFTSNTFDDSKNDGTFHNDGLKAHRLVSKLFKETNNCTVKKAFGECPFTIKNNVPGSFYYVNKEFAYITLPGVYKCDYSSNYPANACGKLPDWNTNKRVEGRVKPTAEYPFAYYLKSNHVAEYNRFDTHDWVNHSLFSNLSMKKVDSGNKRISRYNLNIRDKDEVTILCKASEYELTDVMKHFYELKRNGDKDAKLVMNSFIGTLHPSKVTSKFANQHHVAAIILGRATQNHINMYDKLVNEGNIVLSMIVDSFIYMGNKQYGVPTKSLGALVAERTNSTFRMTSNINQYAFEENNEIVEFKHGALKDVTLERLEDIDKFDSHKDEKYAWQKDNLIRI